LKVLLNLPLITVRVPTSKQEEKAAHSLLRCSSLHPDPISSDPAEMRLQLFGEKPPDIESERNS
jgi:hypothetical protein